MRTIYPPRIINLHVISIISPQKYVNVQGLRTGNVIELFI